MSHGPEPEGRLSPEPSSKTYDWQVRAAGQLPVLTGQSSLGTDPAALRYGIAAEMTQEPAAGIGTSGSPNTPKEILAQFTPEELAAATAKGHQMAAENWATNGLGGGTTSSYQRQVTPSPFGRAQPTNRTPGDSTERKELLAQLRKSVIRAASMAPAREHTPDRKDLVDNVQESQNEGVRLARELPDSPVTLVSGPDQPWEVVTSDPTQYLDLIRTGLRQLDIDAGVVPNETVIDKTAKNYETHELDHAGAADTDPRLKVKLGIVFQRDQDGRLTLQPVTKIDGQTNAATLRRIAGAPTVAHSHGDRARLGEYPPHDK